ncbi:Actin cross-linking toxin VgrG1 [Dissostichus eleginoides]|uniref:Actin cross-linking toxin VgrG1 n=1 Tax=Dissostichus eleginoides TaxID=100907 RepID=A0AAD9B3Y1_DISEL|nr:Actin cross-linking toxin VgrG1 [Dissostichus eleginoides]
MDSMESYPLARAMFSLLQTYHNQHGFKQTISVSGLNPVSSTPPKNRNKNKTRPFIPTTNSLHPLRGDTINGPRTGKNTITDLLHNIKILTKNGDDEQRCWIRASKWAKSKYPKIRDQVFLQATEDLHRLGIIVSTPKTRSSALRISVPRASQTIATEPQTGNNPIGVVTSQLTFFEPPLNDSIALQSPAPPSFVPQIPTHSNLERDTLIEPDLVTPDDPEPTPGRSRPFTIEDFNLLPDPPQNLSTRHEHRGNKRANWFLTPDREILILGDSNISRLPPIFDKLVQVDSYPGANILDAIHLIRSSNFQSDPNGLDGILSTGQGHVQSPTNLP